MLSAFRTRAISSVPWSVQNDIGWGVWPGDPGPMTAAGVSVDERNAAALLAVYGSVTFIGDEISTLPVNVDDGPRPAWVDQPTDILDRIAWLGQVLWSLLISGNSYIAVLGKATNPSALEPLDPMKVSVQRSERGRAQYLVNGEPSKTPIIHIPGRMRPGDLVGLSPVEYTRQTIGLGLAAVNYGAEFFEGPGNMDGVIESPHPMQPETQRSLASQWQAKRKRGGRGLPGILQNGAQWKQTGVTNEQAQFLATRKYTAAEIAGQMFLLDPSDLGIPVEGSNLTYANLEQRNTRRMQVALMPWIRRIEMALTDFLPGAAEYRFDVDSRLRGNTRESYETLKVAVDAGFIQIDEVREILGLPVEQDAAGPSVADIAEMVRKLYLGVDVLMTAEEARAILTSAGADLSASFEQTKSPNQAGRPDGASRSEDGSVVPFAVRHGGGSHDDDDHGNWADDRVTEEEYAGLHRPTDTGPRASNLLEGEQIPNDVYTHPHYYTGHREGIAETMAQLNRVRDNPGATLTIYRAAPEVADDGSPINDGDWVTLSRSYAELHARSQAPMIGPDEYGPDLPIYELETDAGSVRWAMDDLMEWGYYPRRRTVLFGSDGEPVRLSAARLSTRHGDGSHDDDDHGNWARKGIASMLAAQLKATEGFTFDASTGELITSGGVVVAHDAKTYSPELKALSIMDDETFFGDEEAAISQVEQFMEQLGADDYGPETKLGGWWDKSNGEVVLDAVDIISDRDEAKRVGRLRNQQMIFDLDAEELIDTGGTGDREELNAASQAAGRRRPTRRQALERGDGRGAPGAGRAAREADAEASSGTHLTERHGSGSHDESSHGNWARGKSAPERIALAQGARLYRGSSGLYFSKNGESGPGIYLAPDRAVAEKYLAAKDYDKAARLIAVEVGRELTLLDRSTDEGEAAFRSIQRDPSSGKLRDTQEFLDAMAESGYEGVSFPGVTGEHEIILYDIDVLTEVNPTRHKPGGHDHDQSTHGNWAKKLKAAKQGYQADTMTSVAEATGGQFQNLTVADLGFEGPWLQTLDSGDHFYTILGRQPTEGDSTLVTVRLYGDGNDRVTQEIDYRVDFVTDANGYIVSANVTPITDTSEFSDARLAEYFDGLGIDMNKQSVLPVLGESEGIPFAEEMGGELYAAYNGPLTGHRGDGLYLDDLTIETEITPWHEGGIAGYQIDGVILDAAGGQVAEFQRTVDLNAGEVENKRFFMRPDAQGHGIGTAFLDRTEKVLADQGMQYVGVEAVSVGKYAWAARGYEADIGYYGTDSAIRYWRDVAEQRIADGAYDRLTASKMEALWEDFDSTLELHPYDLVLIDPDFKGVLLDGPSWHGSKPL